MRKVDETVQGRRAEEGVETKQEQKENGEVSMVGMKELEMDR